MECVNSERVSGPCHECGTRGICPLHVVSKKIEERNGRSVIETRFYCKDHCMVRGGKRFCRMCARKRDNGRVR